MATFVYNICLQRMYKNYNNISRFENDRFTKRVFPPSNKYRNYKILCIHDFSAVVLYFDMFVCTRE